MPEFENLHRGTEPKDASVSNAMCKALRALLGNASESDGKFAPAPFEEVALVMIERAAVVRGVDVSQTLQGLADRQILNGKLGAIWAEWARDFRESKDPRVGDENFLRHLETVTAEQLRAVIGD